MANWTVVLVIFIAVVEVTTKNGKKSVVTENEKKSVEDVTIWILPIEILETRDTTRLKNFKSVEGLKKQQIKKFSGNPEKKLRISYSDFVRMRLLSEGNVTQEMLKELMGRVKIFYKALIEDSKWHVVTPKPHATRISGIECFGFRRISIEYTKDTEIVGSPWEELQSQRKHVVLQIGLEKTYEKVYNCNEARPIEATFGKQAARDNMALFLKRICKNDIICVAERSPVSDSSYFQSVFGSGYKTVQDLDACNTAILIHINENPKSADAGVTVPWLHVDSNDITTYLDYWALFSELRVHVEMLCELMSQGVSISQLAAEFNSQKKIYFQHLKPPGTYVTMEYIQNLTIHDFEIGSRVLGKGGCGEIRLGRCLQTRQEVALKIERQNLGDAQDKIENRKKTFQKEIKILKSINNEAPGILHTFADGTREFTSNRFDYVNELFVPFVGYTGSTSNTQSSGNGLVNISTNLIGIAVERLNISLQILIDEIITITPETRRKIMLQMFDSVCELHNKEILHRDIKPDNFMIDLNTNRIKLIDFGIAKQYEPSSEKEPNHFKGTGPYASYNCLMFKRYKKGDDLEALSLSFYTVVKGKIAGLLTAEDRKDTWEGAVNAMRDLRIKTFEVLSKSELEETISNFFFAIWNYNHPDQQKQPNNAPAAENETVKPDADSYEELCEKLRLILTNGVKDFNTEIQPGDIPVAAIKSKNFQVLQPEKDIITIPITSALESPLQKTALQKYNAHFRDGVKGTVGIFISLDILINSGQPSCTYATLNAKGTIPFSPQNGTEELLASICSFFPCILIANYDMGEAHVFYRFNLFAHYFVDILHKKHLTKDDLSNLPFVIRNRSSGITKAVVIHGKGFAVDSSSSGGINVNAITYSENEATDNLVTRVYNAIKK